MDYAVNEIFETIQGEAAFTGTPAIFIRMQGCPVGCPWCDTKHTWEVNQADYVPTFEDIVDKDGSDDNAKWSFVSSDKLANYCCTQSAKHVVITGGEPCVQNLKELTTALIDRGFTVQIETSGTHEVRCHGNAWVTLSPKIGMPGGFGVLAEAVKRADEIKMPVGKQADLDKLDSFLVLHKANKRAHAKVWLQPLSLKKKATEICIRTAITKGFKISLQTHKFAAIR